MSLVVPAGPMPAVILDQELLEQARAGDVQAFAALYRRHVGRIYAVCLRLAGNVSVAEECTQDAFVRAWQSLSDFRGDSAFGTWLHRIAVNLVLGSLRSNFRHTSRLVPVDDDVLESVPERESCTATEIALERAIASLPPGAREVFVLYEVEGYTHEEIARLTGIAVGTSKGQLHRARKLLRGRLAS